jgi:hypothetical protein
VPFYPNKLSLLVGGVDVFFIIFLHSKNTICPQNQQNIELLTKDFLDFV